MDSDRFAGTLTDFFPWDSEDFASENIKKIWKSFLTPNWMEEKFKAFLTFWPKNLLEKIIPAEYSVRIAIINFAPCFIFLCSFHELEREMQIKRGSNASLSIADTPPPLVTTPPPSPSPTVICRWLFYNVFSCVIGKNLQWIKYIYWS